MAQKRKGDLAKAAESFGKALKLKPDYSAAISNHGWVLAEQNQWSDARREFERALTINPGDDGALYGLVPSIARGARLCGLAKGLRPVDRTIPQFCLLARVGSDRFNPLLVGIAINCHNVVCEGTFQESEEPV